MHDAAIGRLWVAPIDPPPVQIERRWFEGEPSYKERTFSLLIARQGDGVYLFSIDKDGQIIADNWHETVEDAKDEAVRWHNVPHSAWRRAEAGET